MNQKKGTPQKTFNLVSSLFSLSLSRPFSPSDPALLRSPSPFTLMAHLPTRCFQAHQVFAANTNVGKTILSTGLVRAAAALAIGAEKKRMKAFYLKPVQTGYPVDCDAR